MLKKQSEMDHRAFTVLALVSAPRVWRFLFFIIRKQVINIIQGQHQKYKFPLSPISRPRPGIVKKKVLVLDLDETLLHTYDKRFVRYPAKSECNPPYDFIIQFTTDNERDTKFVLKRPHVDLFLDTVSQWYELVLFTASREEYANAAIDKLDAGRGILQRRFYRQHCTLEDSKFTKNLEIIGHDLSSVFILDNSPFSYRAQPDNGIPIKSWYYDPTDEELLDMLPVLYALRYTADVPSVLSRKLHLPNNPWRPKTVDRPKIDNQAIVCDHRRTPIKSRSKSNRVIVLILLLLLSTVILPKLLTIRHHERNVSRRKS